MYSKNMYMFGSMVVVQHTHFNAKTYRGKSETKKKKTPSKIYIWPWSCAENSLMQDPQCLYKTQRSAHCMLHIYSIRIQKVYTSPIYAVILENCNQNAFYNVLYYVS